MQKVKNWKSKEEFEDFKEKAEELGVFPNGHPKIDELAKGFEKQQITEKDLPWKPEEEASLKILYL